MGLARLISRAIAAGNPDAEKLAVAIALKYFASGVGSSEFLDAAALACAYQPNKTLASRVLEAPGARNLPMARLVPVLEAAEQYEDADQIVVGTLAEMEPYADVAPWLARLGSAPPGPTRRCAAHSRIATEKWSSTWTISGRRRPELTPGTSRSSGTRAVSGLVRPARVAPCDVSHAATACGELTAAVAGT